MAHKSIGLMANNTTKQSINRKIKTNKEPSSSRVEVHTKTKERLESTSSLSESDEEQFEEIGDITLIVK